MIIEERMAKLRADAATDPHANDDDIVAIIDYISRCQNVERLLRDELSLVRGLYNTEVQDKERWRLRALRAEKDAQLPHATVRTGW